MSVVARQKGCLRQVVAVVHLLVRGGVLAGVPAPTLKTYPWCVDPPSTSILAFLPVS